MPVTPYTSSFKSSTRTRYSTHTRRPAPTARPRPARAPPPAPPEQTTNNYYSYSSSYYYTHHTIWERGISESQDRNGIRRRSEADDTCICNTVMYNLISACNACQGDSWTEYVDLPCIPVDLDESMIHIFPVTLRGHSTAPLDLLPERMFPVVSTSDPS